MIPIGESAGSRRTPFVTWALIAANVAVFVYMLTLSRGFQGTQAEFREGAIEQAQTVCYGELAPPTDLDHFMCRWGYQPREFLDATQGELQFPATDRGVALIALFTSLFIHAGWLHIIGNMLFLWAFGDAVEDRFGHLGYLLFYLAGGVAATMAQTAIDVDSAIPSVGASGAIAAVLGGYLVLHPTAWVTILVPVFIVPLPITLPAFVLIGLWFLQNLLAGYAELSTTAAGSGIAFFAHIGGFVFGFLVLLWSRWFGRPPPRRYGGSW